MNLNINPNNKEFIKLKTLLKKTNYCNRLEDGLAAKGDPKYFLPILNYCLLHYSAYVADFLLKNNYELFSKNDKEFVKLVILAMINLFNYKPCISLEEFFKIGFSERKSEMCWKIIEIVIKKNEQLEKSNKSLNNGIKKNISSKIIPIRNNHQSALNKLNSNSNIGIKDTIKQLNNNISKVGNENIYDDNNYYNDDKHKQELNDINLNQNQNENNYYDQEDYQNIQNNLIDNFNYPVLNTFGDRDKQLPINDTKSNKINSKINNNVYHNDESNNYNNHYEKSNYDELREDSPMPCFNNSSTNNHNSSNTNTNYNQNNNTNYNTDYKMNTNQFKNNFNYNNEISYLSNIDYNNQIYQVNNQSQLHEMDLLEEPKSPDFRDLINEEEHNLTKKNIKQSSIASTHKNQVSQINDSNLIDKYISNNNSYVNYDKFESYDNNDSKHHLAKQGFDIYPSKFNENKLENKKNQSGTEKAALNVTSHNHRNIVNNSHLDNGKKSNDVIKPTDINALLELISNLAISVKQMSGRVEDFQSTVESRLLSIEKNVSFLKESNEVLQAENTLLKNEVTLLKRNEIIKNSKYDYYEFNDLKNNNVDNLHNQNNQNKANSNLGTGPFIVNNGNYI